MEDNSIYLNNNASRSLITITATKTDGAVVKDWLRSKGVIDNQIYFSSGIENIVNSDTENGEEILRNIQKMYCCSQIDYLLDEAEDNRLLRSIESLDELLTIEITEEITGDVLVEVVCVNDEGEFVYPTSASVTVSYDVVNNTYSDMLYTALDNDGNILRVAQEPFLDDLFDD